MTWLVDGHQISVHKSLHIDRARIPGIHLESLEQSNINRLACSLIWVHL